MPGRAFSLDKTLPRSVITKNEFGLDSDVMNLLQILDELKHNPRYRECISHWEVIPPRQAVLAEFRQIVQRTVKDDSMAVRTLLQKYIPHYQDEANG